jgi:hypothetical protein
MDYSTGHGTYPAITRKTMRNIVFKVFDWAVKIKRNGQEYKFFP